MININLSKLNHTWLIDIDGTIVQHNGYKIDKDTLLLGVKEFWDLIPSTDIIILLSARTIEYQEQTIKFLIQEGLRYDHIIFGLPTGERILINDQKPKGLNTAIAINMKRNIGLGNLIPNEIDI